MMLVECVLLLLLLLLLLLICFGARRIAILWQSCLSICQFVMLVTCMKIAEWIKQRLP